MLSGASERRRGIVVAVAISCITFLVYLPALQNGFVNWDDPEYIYENHHIRSFDFVFLKWIFTFEANPTWHPLTLFSLGIDYQIWGLNPLGYHLTNVMFHVLNTFLIFVLVIKLFETFHKNKNDSKGIIAAAVTAILFGIHPLHVESVAWVSERKDVLCAFFYLLAILAYLKYALAASGKDKVKYYILCLCLFILSLLSKPMAVTLPLVLLILDHCPLKRITGETEAGNLIITKVPFLALSLAFSIVTIYGQVAGETIGSLESFPLSHRIFAALHGYSFYILKMIFPSRLVPFYPFPAEDEIFSFPYLSLCATTVAATFLSLRYAAQRSVLSTAWLYYMVILLPVSGLIKVGAFAAADRYTYLPSIGPFLLIGTGAAVLLCKIAHKSRKSLLLGLLATAFCILSVGTIKQISIWRDSITLWNHQIKFHPVPYVYSKRGYAHYSLGNFREAIFDQSRAIEIDPYDALAYYNRGNAHYASGNLQQAEKDLTVASQLNVKYALAYFNLGIIHSRMGFYQKAVDDYAKAIEINPSDASSYNNRGLIYFELKEYVKAIKDLTMAIGHDPENEDFNYNRGIVYRDAGEYHKAISDLRRAIELNPGDATAYNSMGEIYLQIGKKELGISYKEKAAKLGLKAASR